MASTFTHLVVMRGILAYGARLHQAIHDHAIGERRYSLGVSGRRRSRKSSHLAYLCALAVRATWSAESYRVPGAGRRSTVQDCVRRSLLTPFPFVREEVFVQFGISVSLVPAPVADARIF